MNNKVGKTAADRVRAADDVATAIDVQGPSVAEQVERVLFEGRAPRKVTVAEIVGLLGQHLTRKSAGYREADLEHNTELSGDASVRDERDAAASDLRELVGGTASVVRGVFGAAASASMGLDVTWAARPDLLLRQAQNAVSLIRKAEVGKPVVGVKIDLDEVARGIEAACKRLDQGLNDVVREERQAQATFQRRETAASDWEKQYTAVAEIFQGMCLLAGHEELAARVKPAGRRSGKHDPEPTTTSNGATEAPKPA